MARRSDLFELGHVESKPEQLSFALGQPPAGVSFLRHGARRFAARQGASYSSEGLEDIQSDPQFQTRVAQAYENAPTDTHRVKKAYRAFADETRAQYDYLTRPRWGGGLGVSVEVSEADPYKTPDEMQADIKSNRRLRVLSSASTGGHPFLSDEENDMFRAVHDAFGHAAIGRSFSRHGEEAAYHSHRQMYTPDAQRALASETRGQNSSFIYRYYGRQFPEQRLVDLPDWATRSRIRRPE